MLSHVLLVFSTPLYPSSLPQLQGSHGSNSVWWWVSIAAPISCWTMPLWWQLGYLLICEWSRISLRNTSLTFSSDIWLYLWYLDCIVSGFYLISDFYYRFYCSQECKTKLLDMTLEYLCFCFTILWLFDTLSQCKVVSFPYMYNSVFRECGWAQKSIFT